MITKRLMYCLILCLTTVLLAGCGEGNRTVKVQYMSDYKAEQIFKNYQPTLSVNQFYDERANAAVIGQSANGYGGNVVSYTTNNSPTQIVEDALIEQLNNAGFKVTKTSGWNLDVNSIPEYITSDYIMGGKLKVFWVESKPGLWTVSANSKVTFDLIIADVKNKKIIWTGQFTGDEHGEHGMLTDEAIGNTLSHALTEALKKIFDDPNKNPTFIDIIKSKTP